jgi:NAD+ kinase
MDDKKTIILFPNADHDARFEVTRRVRGIIEKHDIRAAFCPMLGGASDDMPPLSPPEGMEPSELESELPKAALIITLGGDGTILRAARAAADYGIPILGINMGGKGFMAELEVADIDMVDRAALGEYELETRMMLDVEVQRDGAAIHGGFALNDVVIRGDNKVIDLTLLGDGQRITRFSGDGAVIATPTGSTAYSMAAGGPLVEPTADSIIVTPICAHTLDAKSFVLASDRRVSVELGHMKRNPAYMSADGGDHVTLRGGDVVAICKSGKCARFARFPGRSFYKKVIEKLGEV